VWEPGPNFLGGPAGAPKTDRPKPLPATILGAPVEMLLELDQGGTIRTAMVVE
jgi:hypothetical protein